VPRTSPVAPNECSRSLVFELSEGWTPALCPTPHQIAQVITHSWPFRYR